MNMSTDSYLSPDANPGENFELSNFTLQLPIGAKGKIETVEGEKLRTYTSEFFFTDKEDGSMVMVVPNKGVTTSGSKHPRVELRENNEWTIQGLHKLNVSIAVEKVPSHTTVGQIFQTDGPFVELEVWNDGKVDLLKFRTTDKKNGADRITLSHVNPGSKTDYELSVNKSTLNVRINREAFQYTIDNVFRNSKFYFKAGNYDQTATAGNPAEATDVTEVKIYAISTEHKD